MPHIRATKQVTAAGRVAAIAAVVLAAAGCGNATPADPAGPAGLRDPDRVCAGFATDRAGHDTTTDTGPGDAYQRASAWLHPDLLGQPLPAGRHPQWALWSEHRVVVEVAVAPWAGDGLPADTDQTAYRAVLVSTTPVGADGWVGSASSHTVYCTLGRAGDGWLITAYQVDGG